MNFFTILRTFFGVFLLVLSVSTDCPGTSILILVTPTQVFVAADSKETDSKQHSVGQTCKIRKNRDIYWAAAQIYRDSATGFDVEELVDRAAKKDGNISAKMNFFVEITKAPLEKELAYIKRNDPEEYQKFVAARTDQQNPLQIIFVTFEGQAPKVVSAYFTASDAPSPLVESHVQTLSPGNFGGLGAHQEARKYVTEHPTLLKADLVDAMRTLIYVEINAHAQSVGAPISILEIDPSGAKWREHGQCRDSGSSP